MQKPLEQPVSLALGTASTKDVDQLAPRLSKDAAFLAQMRAHLQQERTEHVWRVGDARDLSHVPSGSVHLIVTSPPYWTLKEYNESEGQLGAVEDYAQFHGELSHAWKECFRVLAAGGRMVVVVGDVVVSRKSALGRHKCFPLHADIQVNCENLGFDNLSPILWAKISNATFEVEGSGGFLGKPFEPGAIIKNDVEFILNFRKPGGYRSPTPRARLLSVIPSDMHRLWFRQVWTDIPGASLKNHPAPYPEALAERLIRMFSFAGDTVLDPFAGTGTTALAAAQWGRNSLSVEIDPHYSKAALERLSQAIKARGLAAALSET